MNMDFSMAAEPQGFDRVKFKEPESIYSPGYFWLWNGRLDVDELNAQLDDMRAHGARSVCIHPFPKGFRTKTFHSGMDPDYLTPAYLEVFSKVVDHAAKLGMNAWLYDEGGWPSGGVCGRIAADDAEGRFKRRILGHGAGGEPFALRVQDYDPSRTDNYPSLIEKGETDEFIRRTHSQYARHIGRHFGKAVKFAFTDEPQMPQGRSGDNLFWTSDFEEVFKAKKGYDIAPFAKDLVERWDKADEALVRVRIDYFDVMADLFVERFLAPVQKWCRENGLLSGGHLNGENVPEMAEYYGYGALLRSYRALDVPGVDVIWRQLFPETDNDPGIQAPFPRYAASVAHQAGSSLVLSESFGVFGNSLSPDQMKWLVDYQMVRGVTLFVVAYYNVSNARQWALLFEPHSGPAAPMWEMEKPFFDYVSRTGSILAEGQPAAEIAVYFDSCAFWAGGAEAEAAANAQRAVASRLDRMNCEYEFVDDDAIATAEVGDGRLCVGAMSYSTIVLPTSRRMRNDAKAKMEEFRGAGGAVLSSKELGNAPRTCRISGLGAENLRVAKRVKGGETLYFVVNESRHDAKVRIDFDEAGPVVLADSGSGDYLGVERGEDGVEWDFEPSGSALFVVGAKADRPADPKPGRVLHELPEGWTVRKLATYALGEEGFEVTGPEGDALPCTPGDWRSIFGESFSGKAQYVCRFRHDGNEVVWLDLGHVAWACSARLNGVELPQKFFGPFRWRVELLEGENVLEVTVANLLANAVSDPVARARLSAKYPPNPSYEEKQVEYDRENHEGGLMGPVQIQGTRD